MSRFSEQPGVEASGAEFFSFERQEMIDRVTNHSLEFDQHTAETRQLTPEEVEESWQTREWKVGEATITAIGVAHTPETFLSHRPEIEQAIRESDIVVNEFAPEAQGLYDASTADQLDSIPSRYNDNYSLEDLRKAYIEHEREFNFGSFHHEVELIVAANGKDMALADLSLTRDTEDFLQDHYMYAYGAEQINKRQVKQQRLGAYAGAAALAGAGLASFLRELHQPTQKEMSRRNFLKLGALAGAGAVIASTVPKFIKDKPETSLQHLSPEENVSQEDGLNDLRDPFLAESIHRLVKAGYKKIAFIYGTRHLDGVEGYVHNDGARQEQLLSNQALIQKRNSDAFRVYRHVEGKNTSDQFSASPHMHWERQTQPAPKEQ